MKVFLGKITTANKAKSQFCVVILCVVPRVVNLEVLCMTVTLRRTMSLSVHLIYYFTFLLVADCEGVLYFYLLHGCNVVRASLSPMHLLACWPMPFIFLPGNLLT